MGCLSQEEMVCCVCIDASNANNPDSSLQGFASSLPASETSDIIALLKV